MWDEGQSCLGMACDGKLTTFILRTKKFENPILNLASVKLKHTIMFDIWLKHRLMGDYPNKNHII
jgi:hypothetical protein